jgi:hypothetical protein
MRELLERELCERKTGWDQSSHARRDRGLANHAAGAAQIRHAANPVAHVSYAGGTEVGDGHPIHAGLGPAQSRSRKLLNLAMQQGISHA